MSRGESAKPGKRGPGLAIAGALTVLVIAATCVVLYSLVAIPRWLENIFSGGPPPPLPAPGDPGAIAHPILGPLRFRECMENALGPTAPSTVSTVADAARVHAFLVDRGYTPNAEDPTPLTLPRSGAVAGLDGSCGVVVVSAAADASLAKVHIGSEPSVRPCRPYVVTLGACGGDVLAIDGAGSVTTRTYVMPGVTREIVDRSGMPTDVLLAHGEAESWLRSRGWEPGDGVIERRVARGTTGRSVRGVGPGLSPPHGCIGWVVVGQGIGQASVPWGPMGSEYEMNEDRFMLGMLTCAASAAGSAHGTELHMTDSDGGGGRVFFRPYHARTGPAVVSHGALASGTATMRVTPSRDIELPTPIDPAAHD